jgi:hypothetical protein
MGTSLAIVFDADLSYAGTMTSLPASGAAGQLTSFLRHHQWWSAF